MEIPFPVLMLVAVNCVALIVYGLDKTFSIWGWRRIPERVLLICMVLGVVGGLTGMRLFKHKTRKTSFQLKALLPVLLGSLLLGAEIHLLF